MNYRWIKIQTHVHTINSDGLDTLRDMAFAAGKKSIDVIFLTDHNTMYGYKDVEDITGETGVKIIKGIEYTTFYGHIISIGAPYFRWETLKDDSLNELADYVHRYNGIIGIAHPMAIGDPVRTGGRYNFKNTDFSKIDFMEEWHGVKNAYNEWEKNECFWADKISRGNIITTLYGGDFHRKEHFEESGIFNWLLIDESKPIEIAVMEAIKSGRVVMSKGPCFHIKLQKGQDIYNMNDIVKLKENEKYSFIIDIDAKTVDNSMLLYLTNNFGQRIEVNANKSIELCGNNDLKWIRSEIFDKTTNEVLAKCNPIYFTYN